MAAQHQDIQVLEFRISHVVQIDNCVFVHVPVTVAAIPMVAADTAVSLVECAYVV